MFKAVILDLDGTLVTFNLDIRACRTEIIDYLIKKGFPRELFSTNETGFDMLVKTKKYLEANTENQKIFFEIKKKVESIIEKYEMKSAEKTKMFPGISETLKELKDSNLKLALCTISGKKATEYILERFGIKSFFDAIITRDNVTDVKPHPDHLNAVLKALNVLPNSVILVGDSTKDIACANRLNVISVGVTTGLSTKEELVSSGANYISSSATELPKLLVALQTM